MPIYEYHCQLCGEACELIQKFSDEPTTTCPHCGKEGLARQISAPSFQLKGTGWYVTDFKNNDKNKKPAPSSDEASKSDKSEATDTSSTSSTTATETKASETKSTPNDPQKTKSKSED